MVRHVTLPKAEMSLGELKALADDDLRPFHFPVRVRISFEPVDSGRVVRWSGREMNLREFLAAIEGQTRLRINSAVAGTDRPSSSVGIAALACPCAPTTTENDSIGV